MQQNPVLNYSNRIMTVGLLQRNGSESCRNFRTVSTTPLLNNNNNNNNSNNNNSNNNPVEEVDKIPKQTQPQLTFFKPSKTNPEEGSAFQFRYSYPGKCVFIESAKQKASERPRGHPFGANFDWEHKLVVKVNIHELGRMLAVLNGSELEVYLLHNFEKDGMKTSSSCKFWKLNQTSFGIQVGRKIDGQESSLSAYIDQQDSILLTEFVRCSIRSGLGFF
jgi:hypothetical protein